MAGGGHFASDLGQLSTTRSPQAYVGAVFGWFGFAAGLVAGGAIGGLRQAGHIPQLEGELFDELRADVPEGSSAVMMLAASEHVDAMIAAFDGLGGRLVRRTRSDAALAALTSGPRCVDRGSSTFVKIVELVGLEPTTFWLPARRSPS